MHVQGAFRAAGHPEIDRYFYAARGGRLLLHRREVIRPLIGGDAKSFYLGVTQRWLYAYPIKFWQELAWLFSAVSRVRRKISAICLLAACLATGENCR